MKKPLVYILIVNYNGGESLNNCLKSVMVLDTVCATVATVVIDNNSDDESLSNAKKFYKDVIFIENHKNIGFSGANNIGIKKALENNAEYIWLVNNDTVLSKNALLLIDAFKDPRVGIAGSKIYFMKGREFHKDKYDERDLGKVIWYAGGIIDWNNMYGFHRGVDEVDNKKFDSIENTDFTSGCSMMISSHVIRDVGFFDEKYFLYLEDLDYCIRAKKLNWQIVYYPKSVLWHENAGSSGGSGSQMHVYYMTRNRILLGFKYAPLRTKLALIKESIRFIALGNKVHKQAVLDAILNKYGQRK